jgi:hypothetical protein
MLVSDRQIQRLIKKINSMQFDDYEIENVNKVDALRVVLNDASEMISYLHNRLKRQEISESAPIRVNQPRSNK